MKVSEEKQKVLMNLNKVTNPMGVEVTAVSIIEDAISFATKNSSKGELEYMRQARKFFQKLIENYENLSNRKLT